MRVKPCTEKAGKTADNNIRKKGKKFATKDSMKNILDKVNEAEDSQLNKKIQRQQSIKKMVEDKNTRSQEKKTKKASRLDEIKKQLRQGYSLSNPTKPPSPRPRTKKRKNMGRTLSAINKEWDAMESSEDGPSTAVSETNDGTPTSPKSKKTVTFAV
ncbi:hypothetical protein H4217_006527 [Coemansia sp. RSA 1939]|nr:hypothetical protein H4217_006527 [Coemansia sp. RSA 1939]KAJ2609264.1 hypothetical protein EV177_004549 [Coemansia sp. RSA 1804]